jgi:hypothetical protein
MPEGVLYMVKSDNIICQIGHAPTGQVITGVWRACYFRTRVQSCTIYARSDTHHLTLCDTTLNIK